RYADVVIVGCRGLDLAERLDRGHGESFCRGRYEDEGDALVFGCLLIRPRRQPDPVGSGPPGGEDLAAVDDEFVAFAHCRRTQGGQIRARFGFGVADREDELAGGDLRQEVVLLLLAAVAHDRRSHCGEGDHRQRCLGPVGFRVEDELGSVTSVLPSELLRPADAEPAVGSDPPHHFIAHRSPGFPLCVEAGSNLVGEEPVEVVTQLLSEPEILVTEFHVHICTRSSLSLYLSSLRIMRCGHGIVRAVAAPVPQNRRTDSRLSVQAMFSIPVSSSSARWYAAKPLPGAFARKCAPIRSASSDSSKRPVRATNFSSTSAG